MVLNSAIPASQTMPSPIDFTRISVVAPVCNLSDLDFLSEIRISDHCDIIELRLDSLTDNLDQITAFLTDNKLDTPILATARHPEEGGCHSLNASARQELYLRFLPLVDSIDIELRSLTEMNEVIDATRSAGKTVILSFHDFESTPSIAAIQSKIDQAIEAGADVCKIAIHLDSQSALDELIPICESESRINLSMMGMGPLGKPSRLAFARAGSVLNYGYLKEANAPGQWPAKELKHLIGEI